MERSWRFARRAARLSGALLLLAGPATGELPKVACLEQIQPIQLPTGWYIEAVARDGSTMVGSNHRNEPVVWRRGESGGFQVEYFPAPPNSALRLLGVSDEGEFIIGGGFFGSVQRSFRWSETLGFEFIETPEGDPLTPSDISADGSRVVGTFQRRLEGDECIGIDRWLPFLWQDGAFTELMPYPPRELPAPFEPPGGEFTNPVGSESFTWANANAISGDGSTVIGETFELHAVIDEAGAATRPVEPGPSEFAGRSTVRAASRRDPDRTERRRRRYPCGRCVRCGRREPGRAARSSSSRI